MKRAKLKPGDLVVYRKTKRSLIPGPRARSVVPSPKGDDYTYCVDKFWRVVSVDGDEVLVSTPTGKQHSLKLSDPNLRRASWWDQWMHRDRFAKLEESDESLVEFGRTTT